MPFRPTSIQFAILQAIARWERGVPVQVKCEALENFSSDKVFDGKYALENGVPLAIVVAELAERFQVEGAGSVKEMVRRGIVRSGLIPIGKWIPTPFSFPCEDGRKATVTAEVITREDNFPLSSVRVTSGNYIWNNVAIQQEFL